jgi:hypothetical protein
LLSKASAKCNWCGEVIEDASYQEAAMVERKAYYQHEAERDAITLARTDAINVWENAIGSQVFRPSVWRKPIPGTITALTSGYQPNSSPPYPPPSKKKTPRFGSSIPSPVVPQSTDGNLIRPWYADDSKAATGRFSMDASTSQRPEIDNLQDEDPTRPKTGRFDHLEIDQK